MSWVYVYESTCVDHLISRVYANFFLDLTQFVYYFSYSGQSSLFVTNQCKWLLVLKL